MFWSACEVGGGINCLSSSAFRSTRLELTLLDELGVREWGRERERVGAGFGVRGLGRVRWIALNALELDFGGVVAKASGCLGA
jgi:hypothetical protein